MERTDFEMLVKYSSRDVLLSTPAQGIVAELKCKTNSWYSNFYSGISHIENSKYSIISVEERITLKENDEYVGDVKICAKGPYERQAEIQMNEEKFLMRRKNLKQVFEVFDPHGKNVLTIQGKVVKEKQWNLFGLIYVTDKLFHSVTMGSAYQNNKIPLRLLLTCGYCIRVFLEIDMGDYPGKVHN